MTSRTRRRIACHALAPLLAGLLGCQQYTLGRSRVTATPNESIENLAPDAVTAKPSGPPSAEIHSPGELAADQAATPQPKDRYAPGPPPSNVHVVQPGETLFSLARKYYGDSKQWRRIYQANRHRISDPQKIKAGMKLIVP